MVGFWLMMSHLQEPLQIDVVLLLFLEKKMIGHKQEVRSCSHRDVATGGVAVPTCSQRFWNMSFSFCVIIFHCLLQSTMRSVLGTSFMLTISSAQYRE